MKFVVSVEQPDTSSMMDPRFGRSPYYAVVESETGETEFIENAATASGHGAGVQAAQSVVGLGVSAVVSGHVGPNAWRVLQAAGVAVLQAGDMSLTEAIDKVQSGELSSLGGATNPGHVGLGMGRGRG